MPDTTDHYDMLAELRKEIEAEREILVGLALARAKKCASLGADKRIIEQSNKLDELMNRYEAIFNGLEKIN